MPESAPIATMIHDLNPWGGQDRSMLEITWQLNKEFPLQIHSFTLEGYEDWPQMEHIRYRAALKKPIILKYLNYQLNSWNRLRESGSQPVMSVGTASLKSNIVVVQFVHHTWQKIAATLPDDKSTGLGLVKSVYQGLLNNYKLFLEKKLYTPDKKYIAISHSIKKELMTTFAIPSENITIIHHGVDHEHFHPWQDHSEATQTRSSVRQSLGLKDSDFVLLHVGALNSRKGLFKTLEVLAQLKKHGFPNVKFLAVGQGDQRILKSLMKQHNIEDRVILAPHSKDIRNYYWAADCFFFPSFYEPFGLVILEAMACGLPVVTSETAGGAELIEDQVNGLLFDPHKHATKLVNVLVPLIKDPSVAQTLKTNGRKTAVQHSWKVVGDQYREFFRQMGQ